MNWKQRQLLEELESEHVRMAYCRARRDVKLARALADPLIDDRAIQSAMQNAQRRGEQRVRDVWEREEGLE